MEILIKLNEANADTKHTPQESAYWEPCMKAAAAEVELMNKHIPALAEDPIPVNTKPEQVEGYFGDCNTPPNEFGYVRSIISKWRKLIIPPGVSPTTFMFVFGQAVEDKQIGVDEDGNPIYETVHGGTFAGE